MELYTYEDYTKDFESDYLGFDNVPDKPFQDEHPENNAEEESIDKIDSCRRL